MSAAEIVDHLDHFQRRVMQDAMAEATAAYWNRRAVEFDAARPRIGDFHGNADAERLRARWHNLTETAQACRNRAQFALIEVWDERAAEARLTAEEGAEFARLHRAFDAIEASLNQAEAIA